MPPGTHLQVVEDLVDGARDDARAGTQPGSTRINVTRHCVSLASAGLNFGGGCKGVVRVTVMLASIRQMVELEGSRALPLALPPPAASTCTPTHQMRGPSSPAIFPPSHTYPLTHKPWHTWP